jgi:hypothetical protein
LPPSYQQHGVEIASGSLYCFLRLELSANLSRLHVSHLAPLQYLGNAPMLLLGNRPALLNAHQVSKPTFIGLIMNLESSAMSYNPPIESMLPLTFYRDNHGLIHFIADNAAYP